MDSPKRKPNRIPHYDYARNGAYFVTICTHKREMLFAPVGADSISARMLAEIFEETIDRYPGIHCPNYVIMPNHFHAILVVERADMESAPTISDVLQTFKRCSTIRYIEKVKQGVFPPFDKQIWQRSFHDHVIRGEGDFLKIWEYVDTNPEKWGEDCFHPNNAPRLSGRP